MLMAAPLVSANTLSRWEDTSANLSEPGLDPFTKLPAGRQLAPVKNRPVFFGVASWYSESDPGINRHTANGEVFNDTKMTCASWDFPFGTRLRVTNVRNGKSVVCTVNDRGPAKRLGRLVDLTKSAFRKIAEPRVGLIRVRMSVVR